MAGTTKIEWTRGDDGTPGATWNPVTGCTKVSPGCDHCYAETIAHRFAGGVAFPNGFDLTLHPGRLEQPFSWRKPRRVFVNSMSDLFHADVPDEYIAKVFAVMAMTPRHTYQILTKRHGRMRSLLSSQLFRRRMYDALVALDYQWINDHRVPWPLPNVWLGVSVEDQKWADIRVPALLDTPAAVRFLSCEPLLGPVDLCVGCGTCEGPEGDCAVVHDDCWLHDNATYRGINWVIVGGESGPHARPMHPDWARAVRDQCTAAGVAYFLKQWGEWAPNYQLRSEKAIPPGPKVRGEHLIQTDHGVIRMHKVGKKAAGRELDGRTWDQYPQAVTA